MERKYHDAIFAAVMLTVGVLLGSLGSVATLLWLNVIR